MENMEVQMKKRERAVNFTSNETRLLADLVFKFRNIIGNKKTDAITNKRKDAAWIKITDLFNSANGENIRSAKNLKLKYESIKKNIKKKAAQNRQELYRTRGGEATPAAFSGVEEKVLAMCSNIDGLEDRNDSDSTTASSSLIIPDTIEKTSQVNLFDEISTELTDIEQGVLNIKQEPDNNEVASCSKWQACAPRILKTKTNPALRKNIRIASVRAKYDELDESRLELVELQKQLARKELEFKQIEHDLHIQQKKEEHEVRMLHLHNEEKRKQEAHNLTMKELKKEFV